MTYQLIKSIVFLAALALPFWLAVRVTINLAGKKRKQPVSIRRELILTCFFVYVIFVAAITIIPTRMSRFRSPASTDINLIPFANTLKCLLPGAAGKETIFFCWQNMTGNILLFVPLGFLLPLISGTLVSRKRVLIVACALSSSIETIQLLSRLAGSFRSVDVDDVLLNTLGAGVGFALFVLVKYALDRRTLKRSSV